MKICSIVGCKRSVRYQTPQPLCQRHWFRHYLTGSFETKIWGKPHMTKYGYLRITVNGKRVQYHRYLMEQFLDRKLSPEENVHHKDGNKTNNNIDNLELTSNSNHIHTYHTKKKIVDWSKYQVPPPASRKTVIFYEKCLVTNCSNKPAYRSLCSKHYMSYRRYQKSES